MKLVTTTLGVGRLDGDEVAVFDLPHGDLADLLRDGIEAVHRAAVRTRCPVAEVRLLAPVRRPGKIVVAGLNYRSHAEELGITLPEEPICCIIPGSAVAGPDDAVALPPAAPDRVDYEGEVAAVIGRPATRLSPSQAWDHVAGLTVCNDVSARDIARRSASTFGFDMALSKGFDTFKPLGPALVTADEFTPEFDLGIKTRVNGELRQDGRTSDLIFGLPDLLSYVTRFVSLQPGDIVSTGTPGGVGMATKTWLRAGDEMQIDVERIGSLRNAVKAPLTDP